MINLLPPALKEARRFGRHNITLLGYSVSVLVIGVFSIGVILFNMRYVKNDESRLQAEMLSRVQETTNLEAGQKDVEKISGQLKTIDKLYTGEVKFSELVPKIGGLLPSGAVLNSLSLQNGKTSPLQLDVDIESQGLAAVFLKNLANSDLFDAADITSIVTKGVAIKPGVKNYPFTATLTASFKGTTKKPVVKAATP